MEKHFESKLWSMPHNSVSWESITDSDANDLWDEIHWLVNFIRRRLDKQNLSFSLNERSLEVANWMLAFNSLEELDHALFLMKFARYSGSAQLFRDVIATNDLIRLINLDGQSGYLEKWFKGAWSNHRDYRKILEVNNVNEADERKRLYESLSQMPHITFKSVRSQFYVGKDDRIWHGSHTRRQHHRMRNMTTPREWIWILASLCKDFIYCLHDEAIITDRNFKKVHSVLREASPKAFLFEIHPRTSART